MYCVVMAGGSGTRFWPMSRQAKPKQLLKIIGDQNMLQITVDRLYKCKKIEGIYISTRKDLKTVIKKEIKGVLPKNIIAEPSGKNTAPCIGLSALHISKIVFPCLFVNRLSVSIVSRQLRIGCIKWNIYYTLFYL